MVMLPPVFFEAAFKSCPFLTHYTFKLFQSLVNLFTIKERKLGKFYILSILPPSLLISEGYRLKTHTNTCEFCNPVFG